MYPRSLLTTFCGFLHYDAKPVRLKEHAQYVLYSVVILHDENDMHGQRHEVTPIFRDSGSASIGKVISKRAPPDCAAAALTSPRCRRAIARQMDSPRPTPLILLSRRPRANLSNRNSGFRSPKPGPLSSRTIRMRSCSGTAVMEIVVPAGVYLTQFSRKLLNIWTMRPPSTRSIGNVGDSATCTRQSARRPWFC